MAKMMVAMREDAKLSFVLLCIVSLLAQLRLFSGAWTLSRSLTPRLYVLCVLFLGEELNFHELCGAGSTATTTTQREATAAV